MNKIVIYQGEPWRVVSEGQQFVDPLDDKAVVVRCRIASIKERVEREIVTIIEQDSLDAAADMALLIEAYRYGQFADDMLDHPSPDCRSPAKPIREALRRMLERADKLSRGEGGSL